MTPHLMNALIEPTGADPGAAVDPLAPHWAGLGLGAAVSALAGCGGGGETVAAVPITPPVVTPVKPTIGYRYTLAATDEEAIRFLLQAQFSASDAEAASVRAAGFSAWLQQQTAQPVSASGWDWLNAKGYADVLNPANFYDSTSPADAMVWSQLIVAPDATRKRMALALSEFFVVSSTGLSFTWRSHAAAAYWDVLNTHAFGNYRDLLEAITLNAAMGYYLNTKGNKKAGDMGSQPDENYAREVMQLFSVGLVLLNADGTPKLTGGAKSDTYTANDVSNLAQMFTGYDLDTSQNVVTPIAQTGGGNRNVGSTAFARLPMVQVGGNHSALAATFLGTTVAANTSAKDSLKIALDTLFNHSNTAPFFSKQLIQRLVTSNPSAAYVGRVAAVFANNGKGVRGDLGAVYRAAILDDEARSPDGLTQPEFGKLREPMVRLIQWARTFNATSTSDAWKIGDLSNAATQLGQSPLRAPSVFNFFRPGYVPPSAALSAAAVAPEFQLVNETSVGGYLNYMTNAINTGINSGDIKAAYTEELTVVTDAQALVQRLNKLLCAGQLSPATQSLMVNALNATAVTLASTDTLKRNRLCGAVLMVMASSEYLVQK